MILFPYLCANNAGVQHQQKSAHTHKQTTTKKHPCSNNNKNSKPSKFYAVLAERTRGQKKSIQSNKLRKYRFFN